MVYLHLWFNMEGSMKINHICEIKVFVQPATFEIGSLAIYVDPTFKIKIYCPADVFCF